MKIVKVLSVLVFGMLLMASCSKEKYPTGSSLAGETFTPGGGSGAEGTSTARDIILRQEVGKDFYLTEDEMWREVEANKRRVRKKYRLWARLRKRKQYSDPTYYGHRRKPKIRPVGKRRYCKECELVH